MDKKTKGAWLLSQSKILDGISGPGAARLETISYAGKVGRLYNLLRRNISGQLSPVVTAATIETSCKLNGIDRATRADGLRILEESGRINVGKSGDVSVLGSTVTSVLEATTEIFDQSKGTNEESAALALSELIAEKPAQRALAEERIGDEFKIAKADVSTLFDVCKGSGIIDQESDKGRVLLFNSNTFRDAEYAKKAYHLIQGLSADEQIALTDVQGQLQSKGAISASEAEKILGSTLYKRIMSVGLFDRLEVSNTSESVGYITSPSDFQRFGRPFEEDPIDDAKALLASLTYGQTRSDYVRGSITMPTALLNALIAGREIGKSGVRAIGEDYRELEKRQVVKVNERSPGRYTMKLLKKDVGELALTIVRGARPAEAAMLMDGSPATNFTGPDKSRRKIRQKTEASDRGFITDSLDRLRTGL